MANVPITHVEPQQQHLCMRKGVTKNLFVNALVTDLLLYDHTKGHLTNSIRRSVIFCMVMSVMILKVVLK